MSMLRPLVLSILILSLLVAGIPVSDSLAARWSRRAEQSWRARHLRHRHTRAWWRRHRAYLRHKRERAMQRRNNSETPTSDAPKTAAVTSSTDKGSTPNAAKSPARLPKAALIAARETHAPFDLTLPAAWSSTASNTSGEMKFNVRTLDGKSAGNAVLAPISAPKTDVTMTARSKTLAGVPLNALRRTVIDQMVAQGGWVINDFERDVRGRRVYVVIAQTGGANAPSQRCTFYFTEVDGRLYRLATTSPLELAEPVTVASEQLVSTFRLRSGEVLAATAPR